jgi:hypothetical protein
VGGANRLSVWHRFTSTLETALEAELLGVHLTYYFWSCVYLSEPSCDGLDELANDATFANNEYWKSPRTISNAQLRACLAGHFYLRPINQVVFLGPYWINSMGFLILRWASYLYAFSTYPLQTQLPSVYPWRDNSYTGGLSVLVLSY